MLTAAKHLLSQYVACDGVITIVGGGAAGRTRLALQLAGQWAGDRKTKYEDGAAVCISPALALPEVARRYHVHVPCAHLRPIVGETALQGALQDVMRRQQSRMRARQMALPPEWSVLVMVDGCSHILDQVCTTAAGIDLLANGRHAGVFAILVLGDVPVVAPLAIREATDYCFYLCGDESPVQRETCWRHFFQHTMPLAEFLGACDQDACVASDCRRARPPHASATARL